MIKSRKAKFSRCPRERAFLHKWLLRKGAKYVRKMKNVPKVIIFEYETDLREHAFSFPKYFTSEERLELVIQFVDYALNINPQYRRLLKIIGLRSKDVGFLLDYSSAVSWNNSYNRLKYIKAIVSIVELYEKKNMERNCN